MRRIIITALAMLLIAVLSSCGSRQPRGIRLEQTPVVSGGIGWAVVSLSYVRIMDEPSMNASDAGTARHGDIGRILSRSRRFVSRDEGVWYRLDFGSTSGWLHESSVSVYSNESEARKMVEALR